MFSIGFPPPREPAPRGTPCAKLYCTTAQPRHSYVPTPLAPHPWPRVTPLTGRETPRNEGAPEKACTAGRAPRDGMLVETRGEDHGLCSVACGARGAGGPRLTCSHLPAPRPPRPPPLL